MTATEKEMFEKMHQNGNGKTELKRPAPPQQAAEIDPQLALQESIGEEAAMAQEVINSRKKRGADLAFRSNIAQVSTFAETDAAVKKQMRKVLQQFNSVADEAVNSVEVEVTEETNFFDSISASLDSVSLSLPGRSSPQQLAGSNGKPHNSSKNGSSN